MRKMVLVSLVLIMLSGHLPAQENPLQRYAEEALRRNLQIETARSEVAVAQKAKEAAAAAFYPTVGFSHRMTRINRAATVDLDLPMPLGEGFEFPEIFGVWQWQAAFRLQAPIYLGGALRRNLELNSAVEKAVDLKVGVEERGVVLAVFHAYIDMKMAEALIRVQRSSLATAEKHREAVAAMLEQGMVSQRELKRAEAVVAEAERELISAETGFELARRAFNHLLNRDLETEVDLSGENGWSGEYSLDEAIENALKSRPELMVLDQHLAIGDRKIDLTRTAYMPNFYAGAEGGWRYGDIQAISGKDYWSVSVMAEIDLFDNTRGVRLAEARASRRLDELRLESARKRIELAVTDSYLKLIEAKKRLSASERGREASEEARRVADLQFKQGLINQVTYLDAELALTAARVQVEQAKYLVWKAEAALRYAAGYDLL